MVRKKNKRRLAISGLVLAILVFLVCIVPGSCQISYLSQAIAGHLRIMGAAKPIEKILKHDSLNPEVGNKLRLVLDVRAFAVGVLDLPDNKSYTRYSKIRDEYPGWNVFCAPEFSIQPVTWCFPFAGCVVYRGYFKKQKAAAFAEKMEKQGYDVCLDPFAGYSTLGWFPDPLLSSQLRYDSLRLASLVIHELAHQEFYKPGDSDFSEAFAVTVERAGVLRWLDSLGLEDRKARALRYWDRVDERAGRMLKARNELNDIYQSSRDTAFMLRKKDSIIGSLEKDLNIRDEKINNAWLVPVSTYHSKIPFFQNLLDSCGGDFSNFYLEVAKMGKKR